MGVTKKSTEEYFPRGGATGDNSAVFKKKTFVFEKQSGAKKVKYGKKERRRKREINSNSQPKDQTKVVQPLLYKHLCPGMKILCSVKAISNNYINVSLPGRLGGRVYASKISQPYSTLLEQEKHTNSPSEICPKLHDIFRKGQHVCCKITDCRDTSSENIKDNLELSVDPADVNSGLTHDLISTGDLLTAAVSSIEDHGYQLFTGIPGLIAFLSLEDSHSYVVERNAGLPLAVGQILWCKVKKCTLLGPCKSISVTIDINTLYDSTLKEDISLDRLNPGNSVDVTIVKTTGDGVCVRIPETDIVGYVETDHLESPWSQPNDYLFGSTMKACVLLKMPHTGNVCFSFKINPTTVSKQEIFSGVIFNDAVVNKVIKGNIVVQLKHNGVKYKGLVPWNKVGENLDKNMVSENFPPGATVTCRVLYYELMDQTYICSMQKSELEEKYLTFRDVKPGDIVDVVIKELKKDGCIVSFGNFTGFVPCGHMSDVPLDKPALKFRPYSSHKGRVLRVLPELRQIVITLKPTLVSNPALVRLDNVHVGDSYYGVICGITTDSIMVSFYGNLKTKINLTFLPDKLSNYRFNEVVKCYVNKVRQGMVFFSLVVPAEKAKLVVGNCYALQVTNVTSCGLEAKVQHFGMEFDVELPVEQLSDHISLCSCLLNSYSSGSDIPNAILYTTTKDKPIFTLRKSVNKFFKKNNQLNGFETLKNEMVIPCTVDSMNSEGASLIVPIPGFNKEIFVPKKDLYDEGQKPYEINQGVMAKLLLDNKDEMKLICAMKRVSIKVEWIIHNLISFLEQASLFQTFKTGMNVSAVVIKVLPQMVTLKLHTGETATMLRKSESIKYTVDEEVEATVIFQDPVFGSVHVVCRKEIKIQPNKNRLNLLSKSAIVSGTIVFGNTHFLLAVLNKGKLKGLLIYIPVHLHPNSSSYLSLHDVGYMTKHDIIVKYVGKKITVGFLKQQNIIPFEKEVVEPSCLGDLHTMNKQETSCVSDSDNEDQGITVSNKTDHSDEEETMSESNSEIGGNTGKQTTQSTDKSKNDSRTSSLSNTNKRKSTQNENEPIKKKKLESADLSSLKEPTFESKQNTFVSAMNVQMRKQPDASNLSLSEAASFIWNATPADLTRVTSGAEVSYEIKQESDDEVTTKRKLTPSEKRIAAQEKEKKIREKEEDLLNIENDPKSVDHFERLVLGSPNSSVYWVKYMIFHLQATEIEKARVIAKRALKQMNVREETERMNIWVALLNLENLYGTSESFKEVLDEALKLSDDYQIYLKVLEIYASSNKTHELEQLANMMISKYRTNSDCYLHCMSALMKVGLREKSRNYLQRALGSIHTKEHVTLISRFALMENHHGFPEEAQALFENVLTSYPSRVDVWSVYVDMLIKSKSIDMARQVLERAAGQHLPAENMKSIYSKWLSFEENYGNENLVQKVKEAALQYVINATDQSE